MKTYVECELAVSQEVERISAANKDLIPLNRMLFKLELAMSIAAREMYAAELLRDESNTAEMHALHDKLAGWQKPIGGGMGIK